MNDKSDIIRRKADHIDVVLGKDVGFARLSAGFDEIRFTHAALPELSLAQIDLRARLFGRELRAPFLISSMTGGPAHAERINAHLAECAQGLGIAMAVGSQRIALEDQGSGGMTRELRRRAPDVPLIGNLGAAQIRGAKGIEAARRAVEMIEADGLFIHLNPLQEAVQRGGDTDWTLVLAAIEALARAGLPIAVKEVGFGLSADTVRQLTDAGVGVIDVAGAGGTNWARVEGYRDAAANEVAAAFTEWGIPTARAIADARATAPDITLIGSGGVRSGVDAAKAIRLGADIVGQAAPTLSKAIEGPEPLIDHFTNMMEVLRITCFVTGSRDIAALKKAPLES